MERHDVTFKLEITLSGLYSGNKEEAKEDATYDLDKWTDEAEALLPDNVHILGWDLVETKVD